MRTEWRVAPGEAARLTPDGPTGATILSQGFLPFRVRTAPRGVHHRPAFPGSTVLLGEEPFEVVSETHTGDGVLYSLEPWPTDQIVRERIVYGPRLVRSAQEQRRHAQEREKAKRYSWLLYPVVGLLSEERQVRACDRLGLDDVSATLASGLLELVVFVAGFRPIAEHAGPAAPLLAVPYGLLLVFPAAMRTLGAFLFSEVAGSSVVTLAEGVGRLLLPYRERLDATLLPLTRPAFWARLSLPDRQERQQDGSWVVRSTIPHLSWRQTPRIRVGRDWWMVTTPPPAKQGGRLVYTYHLTPLADDRAADTPKPMPPAVTAYQEEVLRGVAREWDDLLGSGAWLVSLLPATVQRRAVERWGGPRALRLPCLVTAGLSLAGAAWLCARPGPLTIVAAILLFGDGTFRLFRVYRGRYAPSLVGGLVSDYLKPERRAYSVHRTAEKHALRSLGEAPPAGPPTGPSEGRSAPDPAHD